MQYLELPLRSDNSSTLCAYILNPEISFQKYKTRPAIIVCPGGAYLSLATKEGEAVAVRWLGLGYNVFVLRYVHYFAERPKTPEDTPVINEKSHVPEQLIDLMRAMDLVKAHAEEWDIDPNRVYAMGFSAGAHLVGSLAVHFDKQELLEQAGTTAEIARPAGVVMGYPMISDGLIAQRPLEEYPEQMRPTVGYIRKAIYGTDNPSPEARRFIDLRENVRADMPRVFIWHTTEDTVVPPYETTEFILQLQKQGVPCEYHLYQKGPHGTALCDESSASSAEDVIATNATWVAAAHAWLSFDAPNNSFFHL